MMPSIWIFDTYTLLMMVGVFASMLLFYFYSKKVNYPKNYFYDILITSCISIIVGLGSATLFQLIFNLLKQEEIDSYFAMTFFGGLVGGVISFLLIYFIRVAKRYPDISFLTFLKFAPSGITIAHGFGRIGCFCAGCCYGKETDSPLGVKFPFLDHNVYPTQLFEAIFLIVLSAVLFYLAYKKSFKYTFSVYLISYGIFRFLIEFIRGDDRGAFLFNVLSPSQVFSIIAFIIGIAYIFYINKKYPSK